MNDWKNLFILILCLFSLDMFAQRVKKKQYTIGIGVQHRFQKKYFAEFFIRPNKHIQIGMVGTKINTQAAISDFDKTMLKSSAYGLGASLILTREHKLLKKVKINNTGGITMGFRNMTGTMDVFGEKTFKNSRYGDYLFKRTFNDVRFKYTEVFITMELNIGEHLKLDFIPLMLKNTKTLSPEEVIIDFNPIGGYNKLISASLGFGIYVYL